MFNSSIACILPCTVVAYIYEREMERGGSGRQCHVDQGTHYAVRHRLWSHKAWWPGRERLRCEALSVVTQGVVAWSGEITL